MDRLADSSLSAAIFTDTALDPLPERASVVVVGGGIVGSSIAYHLAASGISDVLLLEQGVLTNGTTWHAAGLVAGARATTALTELSQYGRTCYQGLAERSGIDVSFTECGSLSIARQPGRVTELEYGCDVANAAGVAAKLVDVDEIQRLWPLAATEGLLAGLYFPGDGYVNPGYASIALAKCAAELGVAVRERVAVTELKTSAGRVTGVATSRGDVAADTVVLAGGLWTRDLAAGVGVPVPLYAAEHVHVRSGPLQPDLTGLPVLRDMDNSYYIRAEADRLLVGAFEPRGLPRPVAEVPPDGFAQFPPNWEHFAPIRTQAEQAVPALVGTDYDRFINAPESFTPDTNFLMGETAEVAGLFVAAGMNSQGIIYAPGVGKELAAWISSGAPQFDSSAVDVQRFSPQQSNRRYLHERTREGLGRLYAMHWPNYQSVTARNLRRTPLHHRVAELGAVFGELNGQERANWYGDIALAEAYSFERPGWFEQVAAEHQAARAGVGLLDLSPFAKFEVAGPDALVACQRAATADVDLPIGRGVYTLFLNQAGGIELDGTVTRLDEERFLVITPSFSRHKSLWLLRRRAQGLAASVFDATSSLATIAVVGPRSRELLSLVSPNDWSDDVQPYYSGRQVEVGDGFGFALRVSFTGELGYEIYLDSDIAVNVLDAMWQAGQSLDARMVGYFALDSLRLEKGYRHLGHDIGPPDDPYTAGLGFTVSLGKDTSFVGEEVVAAIDRTTLPQRTAYVALTDSDPMLFHDEVVTHDGRPVGRITSGGYGHTLGRAVGIARIERGLDLAGDFAVVSRGRVLPAEVSAKPFYDPGNERVHS
jgi:glycine cleavage system aminomethyltransferase T/glycine/D-amino acid oxidase-like deaminating enzyme